MSAMSEQVDHSIGDSRASILRRLSRNAMTIIGGNGIAMLMGVGALSLNVRGLGASAFGVFAMIQAYATVMERIFSFDTWQPLIRLGAKALAEEDRARFREILLVAVVFDLIAAFTCGVAAVGIAWFAGGYVGIAPDYAALAALYSAALFFSIGGAPVGLFRLLNRFSFLTTLQIFYAAARLAIAGALFHFQAGLQAYVYAYALVAVAYNVHLIAASAVFFVRSGGRLSAQGFRGAWRSLRGEYWSFSWATNITSTINILRQNADLFLLGYFAGPAAAGIYQVASRIAQIPSRISDPIQQAVYPELAKLAGNGRQSEILYYVLRLGGLCGLIAIAALLTVVFFGGEISMLVGGARFVEAREPLILLMIAFMFSLSGVALRPAIMSTVGPKFMLMVYVIAFGLFVVVAPLAIQRFGLFGAGASQIVFNAVWFTLMLAQLLVAWRRR
ncbi:MAG TPA: oligosaccharide flippase family protein [Parvibaculum sp.]|jgi:O-antigen/teichoic acid export membrane protein